MAHPNLHLYENLLTQIESQVEAWNRQAVRHPNPEEAHRLWQKAEGLQYALRILYAFRPEFDDLVQAATQSPGLSAQAAPPPGPAGEVGSL